MRFELEPNESMFDPIRANCCRSKGLFDAELHSFGDCNASKIRGIHLNINRHNGFARDLIIYRGSAAVSLPLLSDDSVFLRVTGTTIDMSVDLIHLIKYIYRPANIGAHAPGNNAMYVLTPDAS